MARTDAPGLVAALSLSILALVTMTSLAQRGSDELSGAIEVSTKEDGAIAVLTIDVFLPSKTGERKVDGLIDSTFVVVRPSAKLAYGRQLGHIKLPSSVRQFDHKSLEISFEQPSTQLLITLKGEETTRGPKITANRILRLDSNVDVTSHKYVEGIMFSQTFWDTLRLGRQP